MRSTTAASTDPAVRAAASRSRARPPRPAAIPVTAAPTEASATFSPALVTNTCARAYGGAYLVRAARVAVNAMAFTSPMTANPASANA
jgi:hypothetical protein